MPPIAQKKYLPLYRLDYLITKKSFIDRVSQKSIRDDICALLDISKGHLWKIRRVQAGSNGIISATDLIKLATYFSCTLDELVVRDHQLPASPPIQPGSSDVSPEEPGHISSLSGTTPYETLY